MKKSVTDDILKFDCCLFCRCAVSKWSAELTQIHYLWKHPVATVSYSNLAQVEITKANPNDVLVLFDSAQDADFHGRLFESIVRAAPKLLTGAWTHTLSHVFGRIDHLRRTALLAAFGSCDDGARANLLLAVMEQSAAGEKAPLSLWARGRVPQLARIGNGARFLVQLLQCLCGNDLWPVVKELADDRQSLTATANDPNGATVVCAAVERCAQFNECTLNNRLIGAALHLTATAAGASVLRKVVTVAPRAHMALLQALRPFVGTVALDEHGSGVLCQLLQSGDATTRRTLAHMTLQCYESDPNWQSRFMATPHARPYLSLFTAAAQELQRDQMQMCFNNIR